MLGTHAYMCVVKPIRLKGKEQDYSVLRLAILTCITTLMLLLIAST